MCALSVTFLASCSCDSDETKVTSVQQQEEALRNFDTAFKSNFSDFLYTRSVIADASDEDLDSIMTKAGDETCDILIEPSEELLTAYGLTSKDLEEIANEVAIEEGLEEIPLKALKCYSALAFYEISIKEVPETRATVTSVASCIALGGDLTALGNYSAKQIAKLAAKNLAKRFVPYIGWCWGVASAVDCLAGL